jgi:hypothetical protein
MPLDAATYDSSNTYFVGLEDQIFNCDLRTIVATAQKLGINSLTGRTTTPTPARRMG